MPAASAIEIQPVASRQNAIFYEGTISVIMPAFNEGYHIFENLKETVTTLETLAKDHEIIVVNDGSHDDTSQEIIRATEHFPTLKFLDFSKNQGKGHALREGFGAASGDLIVFLDSDLELHPQQLDTLLTAMRRDQADIVIGSKFHPLSTLAYPALRHWASRLYALMLKILFNLPLRDTQSGLKIYKRCVLDKVFPVILSKRYAYDLEILANAHHLGYRITEAPVQLIFRRLKQWGRLRLRDFLKTGLDTLAIFYRMYILRYYDGRYQRRELPSVTSVDMRASMTQSLLRNSVLVFALSTIGNMAAYFYQFVMSRSLAAVDYGLLNALLSFVMLFGSLTVTIQTTVAKFSAEFPNGSKDEGLRSFVWVTYVQALIFAVFVGVFLWAITPLIKSYFHVDQPGVVLTTIMLISVSFMLPVALGLLQGRHRFFYFGALSGLGGLLRLAFGLLLVVSGLGLLGAMTANVLASLVILVIAFYLTVPAGSPIIMDPAALWRGGFLRDTLVYGFPVLLGHAAFAALVNIDMIMVRHFFPSQVAGYYAAAAVLARAILFINGSIVAVLLPLASSMNAQHYNASNILKKGLFLCAMLSGCAALIFSAAPSFWMRLFVGSQYSEASSILGPLSLAILPFAALQLVINYNFATRRLRFLPFLIGGALLQLALIYWFHNSVTDIIFILFLSGVCLLGSHLGLVILEERSARRHLLEKHN